MAHIQFVIGGARSGKSALAENLAKAISETVEGRLVYVATAQIFDDEMQTRIDLHRQRRGPEWDLVEAPIDLDHAIAEAAEEDNVLLIDCLSVWITNILINDMDTDDAREKLVSSLAKASGHIVLVASETGLGIVPENKLSRQFRDASGTLNQAVAALADEVFFVMAGIATKVKPQP